jgi:phosphoribosylamine-glycine ligase
VANGGRVLNVTARQDRDRGAALAYAAVDMIDWPEGFCRRDIGWRGHFVVEENPQATLAALTRFLHARLGGAA